MNKRKIFAAAVLAVLFASGCSKGISIKVNSDEVQETLPEEIKIDNSCTLLSNERAIFVFQEMLELKEMLNEGIQTMENPSMVFSKQKKEGNTIFVEAAFEADYTITRNPVDNPIIQGMYEAKESLKTDKEKKYADECIQGYLIEMNAVYQKTERYPTIIVVSFSTEDQSDTYELFYPLESASGSSLEPLKQYALENWKEDAKARKEMGGETLLRNVEISMENP